MFFLSHGLQSEAKVFIIILWMERERTITEFPPGTQHFILDFKFLN